MITPDKKEKKVRIPDPEPREIKEDEADTGEPAQEDEDCEDVLGNTAKKYPQSPQT